MPSDAREALRLWVASGALPSCASNEEAEAVVEAARVQGVAGLLHGAVAGEGGHWPAPAVSRLRELHRGLLARGVAQLDLARRARDLLTRAGVRSIPLKGVALAETHYPSVADRPMSDVDLLALEGGEAARAELVRAGFHEVEAADHACALRDPVTGGILELHHSVCSCPGFYPLDAEGVWARSRATAGQVGRVPSIEDLLVHLSLHAVFQHGLVLSLVQHADFRRVLDATPPDPDRLMALAAAGRAEAAVAVALAAAEAVVAAPIGGALRERLRPHVPPALRPWLRQVATSPLRIVTPATPALLRVRWEMARGRRAEWLWRTLAPPSPGTTAAVPRALRALTRGLTLARRWAPQPWRRP